MADNTVLDLGTGGNTVRTLEDGSNIHWPVGVVAYATTIGTPDVLTIPTAAALADATANPTTLIQGAAMMVWNGSSWDRLKGKTTGLDISDISAGTQSNDVKISLDGEAVVLGAGSEAIGKLGANDGVDIGDVTLNNATIEVVGDAAENAAAAGNPVLMGGRYDTSPRTLGDGDVGAIAVDVSGAAQVTSSGGALALESGGNLAAAVTSLQIIDDWEEGDRAKVNLIVGQSGIAAGAGAVGATVPRVTLASDDPAVAHLATLAGAVSGSEMQVDVLSIVPGTGATALGKAEDAPHTTGDTGVMALAVQQTSDAALAGLTGDYAPLQVDDSGFLKVNVKAGGGAGGTSMTDDSNFVVSFTGMTPVGGLYRTSRDGVNDGDAGCLAMTETRALYTSMETPNGDSAMDEANDALRVNIVAGGGSGGTAMSDDASFTVGSTNMTPVGGTYRSVRDSVNDNDAGAFAMTQTRALLACLETPAGDSAMDDTNDAVKVNIVAGGGAGGTSMTDDAAFTPGSTAFTPAGGTFDDTAPDSVDEGDGGAFRMSSRRELYVQIRDAAGNERGLNVDASGNIGISSLPAGTNNIGDVDVLTMPGTAAEAAALPSSFVVVAGDDGTDTHPLQTDASGNLKITQTTHDNLQANANLQVSDTDVSSSNPVPIQDTPQATGGASFFKSIDLDESEEQIKGTAGTIYSIHAMNLASSARYLKLYNATAASVVVGTTVPDITIPLPTQGDTNGAGFVWDISKGIAFGTAITAAATTGIADNDSGAPGANEVVVTIVYK